MEKMLETGRTTKGIKKEIAVVAKQAALKYHLQVKQAALKYHLQVKQAGLKYHLQIKESLNAFPCAYWLYFQYYRYPFRVKHSSLGEPATRTPPTILHYRMGNFWGDYSFS